MPKYEFSSLNKVKFAKNTFSWSDVFQEICPFTKLNSLSAKFPVLARASVMKLAAAVPKKLPFCKFKAF